MTNTLEARTAGAAGAPEMHVAATATAATTVQPDRPGAGLTLSGLEAVYDALADAIDEAGPQKTELFLVKLALLNAQALGDERLFMEQLQRALKDL